MDIVIIILRVALVLLCLFMGLIILMQRTKQEGLGAAFGSSMTDSVFGAQTTNVLVKATVWCAVVFFVLVLSLDALLARRLGGSLIDTRNLPEPAPAAAVSTNTPATNAVPLFSTNATLAEAPAGEPAPATNGAANP
jgi:preprotein translocase subunit SecG